MRLLWSGMIIAALLIGGCSDSGWSSSGGIMQSTTVNPVPADFFKENEQADLFMWGDIVYVPADTLEWVQQLKFAGKEKVGEITATGDPSSTWVNGMSSRLPEGTTIYQRPQSPDSC